MGGVARTGASLTNGSGDYVIAFSTAEALRRSEKDSTHLAPSLSNNEVSPLFQAVIEATEEAIYNSLLMAEDVDGHRGKTHSLPINKVKAVLSQ